MRESRRKAVLWVIKQNLKYLEDQSLYIYLTLLNWNEVTNVLENLQIFGISSLVSNEWMKEENKRKFFRSLNRMNIKTQYIKNMEYS